MGSGGVKAGDRVGIIGLGGLGLTGARFAVLAGATVYAAEPRTEVWSKAIDAGVTEVFASADEMKGMDLDVVIDFAGYNTTNAALWAVKPGGLVVQVGASVAENSLDLSALVPRNVRLHGSSPIARRDDLQTIIDLLASGRLRIEATKIDFEEIPAGIARLHSGGVIGRLWADTAAFSARAEG